MEPADWRQVELDSLEKSLARLKRHTGLQPSQLVPGLEVAKLEMAKMVEEAAAGRAAKCAALELGAMSAMSAMGAMAAVA